MNSGRHSPRVNRSRTCVGAWTIGLCVRHAMCDMLCCYVSATKSFVREVVEHGGGVITVAAASSANCENMLSTGSRTRRTIKAHMVVSVNFAQRIRSRLRAQNVPTQK